MNAIDHLVNEHERVKTVFEEIGQQNKYTKKKQLFRSVCFDLLRHEKMEQTLWYPILKEKNELNEIIKHLIEEEQSTVQLIREFDEIKTEAEWAEKFNQFKKEVNHHADEEENKLFPNVTKILSDADLQDIGNSMQEFGIEGNKLKKEVL